MPNDSDLQKHVARMREASGKVDIDSRLVGFLYILLRDHLTPGVVEEIMIRHCAESNSQYTNGWLARYAEDLAERLMTL